MANPKTVCCHFVPVPASSEHIPAFTGYLLEHFISAAGSFNVRISRVKAGSSSESSLKYRNLISPFGQNYPFNIRPLGFPSILPVGGNRQLIFRERQDSPSSNCLGRLCRG